MLYRASIEGVVKALASARCISAPRRVCVPLVVSVQRPAARGMCAAAAPPQEDAPKRKPHWTPGTPAPGRGQTIGEAFAAMQHHGRGTRKVKASVLHGILDRVSSEEELKYALLGLKLFKKQGIALDAKAATLFLKACCRAGSPEVAVDALADAEAYGLEPEGVVRAHRFNFLLSQLYRGGKTEVFSRAVADARARQQSLNPRSHVLISKFEAEMTALKEAAEKAQREEEERKAEKERVKLEEEARAAEAAEAEKARAEAEEEAAKDAEEAKQKEKEAEEQAAAAAAAVVVEEEKARSEAAGEAAVREEDAGDMSPEGDAEHVTRGDPAPAAQEGEGKP